MDDQLISGVPAALAAIRADTERLGFTMASESQTGSLLRTLAASKRGGRLLELGTGTGVGTAWLLAGMDEGSRLDTVESDPQALEIARCHLGHDSRVTFHRTDAAAFLRQGALVQYDLIYADPVGLIAGSRPRAEVARLGDTWPGKFTDLDLAPSLVRVGGLYVVGDLLPQASWPEGHGAKIPPLIADLEAHPDFVSTKLAWASGLMILARVTDRG